MTATHRVRTVFLSDCHLGWRFSKPDSLVRFIESHEAETFYLVGDIIDGMALQKKWRWQGDNDQVLRALLAKARNGARLFYAPGNHDEFLRRFLLNFGLVDIAHDFVHETADGRRLLVIHGDEFDGVSTIPAWLNGLGCFGYDAALWMNGHWMKIRSRLGWHGKPALAGWKQRIGAAARFLKDFEERIAAHARTAGFDGVVCGHVHTPVIRRIGDTLYCNTGDWVESCSALVEDLDGTLRLVFDGNPPERTWSLPDLSPSKIHMHCADRPQRRSWPTSSPAPAVPV